MGSARALDPQGLCRGHHRFSQHYFAAPTLLPRGSGRRSHPNPMQSPQPCPREAADFESYTGCAKVIDFERYLSDFGFEMIRRDVIEEKVGVGSYYDLLFRRRSFKKKR